MNPAQATKGSAHTPGPWSIKVDVFGGDRAYIRSANGPAVAEAFCSDKISYAARTHNARLIAAAPELLQALEKSERRLTRESERLNREILESTSPVTVSGLKQARNLLLLDLSEARAAIAKATGGAL